MSPLLKKSENNVNNTVLYLKTGTEFEVLETIDTIIDMISCG